MEPSVGRIVHAFSDHWEGARMAHIVGVNEDGTINVNVSIDRVRDGDLDVPAIVGSIDGACAINVGFYFPGLEIEDAAMVEEGAVMPEAPIYCIWPE